MSCGLEPSPPFRRDGVGVLARGARRRRVRRGRQRRSTARHPDDAPAGHQRGRSGADRTEGAADRVRERSGRERCAGIPAGAGHHRLLEPNHRRVRRRPADGAAGDHADHAATRDDHRRHARVDAGGQHLGHRAGLGRGRSEHHLPLRAAAGIDPAGRRGGVLYQLRRLPLPDGRGNRGGAGDGSLRPLLCLQRIRRPPGDRPSGADGRHEPRAGRGGDGSLPGHGSGLRAGGHRRHRLDSAFEIYSRHPSGW